MLDDNALHVEDAHAGLEADHLAREGVVAGDEALKFGSIVERACYFGVRPPARAGDTEAAKNVLRSQPWLKSFGVAQAKLAGVLLVAFIGDGWGNSYPRNSNASPLMFWGMMGICAAAAWWTVKEKKSANMNPDKLKQLLIQSHKPETYQVTPQAQPKVPNSTKAQTGADIQAQLYSKIDQKRGTSAASKSKPSVSARFELPPQPRASS